VFQILKGLAQYVDEGATNRSWSQTTNLLIQEQAALQVMGDWARGEFALAGKTAGTDYSCLIGPMIPDFPNARIAGDIFVFFKQGDAEVERAQLSLASLMVSSKVQALFNSAKGSAPIRDDVDMSVADECMRTGISVLSKPGAVQPATNRWRNEAFHSSQNAIFSDLLFNPNTTAEAAQEQFVNLLRNAD
jgi:glucose/mannose transport system substrate-binding protein